MEKKKIDIIWNITRLCTWDCTICCVDAVQAKYSSWPEILKTLEQSKSELTLEKKMQVLQNLKEFDCKIDFSGGDPLCHPHTYDVLQEASSFFGNRNISITATGSALCRFHKTDLLPYIGELNFTYDYPISCSNYQRPIGYNNSNLLNASRFQNDNLTLRAECPLSIWNIDNNTLKQLYLDLYHYSIDELLVMRMFPVGRGMQESCLIVSQDDYKRAIYLFREMEELYGRPKVKFQCALKILDPNANLSTNSCDLVQLSYGLMPNGILLSSPWAYGLNGKPLGSEWILGNLAEESLESILSSPLADYYREHINDNVHHCKIYSWYYSHKQNGLERIFDQTDPIVKTNSYHFAIDN
ncbi:MAG: hypothetical protein WBB64_12045 [Anaerolineales bacterium]